MVAGLPQNGNAQVGSLKVDGSAIIDEAMVFVSPHCGIVDGSEDEDSITDEAMVFVSPHCGMKAELIGRLCETDDVTLSVRSRNRPVFSFPGGSSLFRVVDVCFALPVSFSIAEVHVS